jgi:hypothetical protein
VPPGTVSSEYVRGASDGRGSEELANTDNGIAARIKKRIALFMYLPAASV